MSNRVELGDLRAKYQSLSYEDLQEIFEDASFLIDEELEILAADEREMSGDGEEEG